MSSCDSVQLRAVCNDDQRLTCKLIDGDSMNESYTCKSSWFYKTMFEIRNRYKEEGSQHVMHGIKMINR